MPIEITSRHMQNTGDMQKFSKEKAQDLLDEFSRIEHIHVILDQEKHRSSAEVIVQAKNHIRLEAEDSSDNMHASITSAFLRAEKQLRKLRDKVMDHRPKGEPIVEE